MKTLNMKIETNSGMKTNETPTSCIVHKGFRGFRAVSLALISGGNLTGLKPAIPYEIIH